MGNQLTPALIHKYRTELMQFAVNKAVAGESVLYLSLEMPLDTLRKRLDSELEAIKPGHSWKSLKGCMSAAFLLNATPRDISKALTDFQPRPTVLCIASLEWVKIEGADEFDIDQFAKANGIQVATFTADGCVVTVPRVDESHVPLFGVPPLPEPADPAAPAQPQNDTISAAESVKYLADYPAPVVIEQHSTIPPSRYASAATLCEMYLSHFAVYKKERQISGMTRKAAIEEQTLDVLLSKLEKVISPITFKQLLEKENE